MPKDGSGTRERILDAAEALVLERGFGGTAVDAVLARAGITKGAFFYHFKSKAALGRALLDRYVARDDALLAELVGRAERLAREPLQQYLLFVGLLEELLAGLATPHPGCLVASFVYELEAFDAHTQEALAVSFDRWRTVLGAKLAEVFRTRQPRLATTPTQLVDNLLTAFEGGVILARLAGRPEPLAEQVRAHRNYVELLLAGAAERDASASPS
jgi:TetR/AcrR family transcriptional repressor of nem operon